MDTASVLQAPNGEPDSAVASAPPPPSVEKRVADLAKETTEYARAWIQLATDEAALAKTNLVRIVVVALLVPALATGVIVSLDALGTALLEALLHSWSAATAIVGGLNIAILLGMAWMLRSWAKTLSLPRSRAAFNRLWSP